MELKPDGIIAQCPVPHPKKKILPIPAKDSVKIEIEAPLHCVISHENEFFLKYFVHGCLSKQLFVSNSPQAPSNLIFFLTILTQFNTSLTQF